ncbi:MAG: hypothetical protein NE328_16665 [Lentisphaeraceae bacterium]|nr:hypothetical protein [Lentisphaeraceae bacterium]
MAVENAKIRLPATDLPTRSVHKASKRLPSQVTTSLIEMKKGSRTRKSPTTRKIFKTALDLVSVITDSLQPQVLFE